MTRSKIAGAVVGLTAFVACPCHLPITLPLVIAVFGGGAVGALLAANTTLVVGLSTLWFVLGLTLAWRLFSRPSEDEDIPRCSPQPQRTSGHASTVGGPEHGA